MRRSFTLLELICTLCLTVLLLGVVMNVVGQVATQVRVLQANADSEEWEHFFADQLRDELARSYRFRQEPNELRLIGYFGRDFESNIPTGRPTEIRYKIRKIEGKPWLFRRETHLDEMTNQNFQEIVCCRGVDRIEVLLPDEREKQPIHAGRIPTRMQLLLLRDEERLVDVRFTKP